MSRYILLGFISIMVFLVSACTSTPSYPAGSIPTTVDVNNGLWFGTVTQKDNDGQAQLSIEFSQSRTQVAGWLVFFQDGNPRLCCKLKGVLQSRDLKMTYVDTLDDEIRVQASFDLAGKILTGELIFIIEDEVTRYDLVMTYQKESSTLSVPSLYPSKLAPTVMDFVN